MAPTVSVSLSVEVKGVEVTHSGTNVADHLGHFDR